MNQIGRKLKNLTIVRATDGRQQCSILYEAVCDYCGGKVIAVVGNLKRYDSCGCRRGRKTTHGHAAGGKTSRTYNSWAAMRGRCLRQKDRCYDIYGGRGITICERWSIFQNFVDDMGERPEEMTLDRMDPDGNYEPSNCRWADKFTQRRNRRVAAK